MVKLGEILLAFSVVIVASGCVQNAPEEEGSQSIETIEISGMDTVQTISPDKPTEVLVSGMNANVTIEEDSDVTRLTISGMDAVVYLPEGSDAVLDVTGKDAEIIRY
jgi:hypothetical protein